MTWAIKTSEIRSNADIIMRCGCYAPTFVPPEKNEVRYLVKSPDGTEEYSVQCVRIGPELFMDKGEERPQWMQDYHVSLKLDTRLLPDSNWQKFEHIFADLRGKGPTVPVCWLPDLFAGRGRFFGFWKTQSVNARVYGHLSVVEPITVDTATDPW